MEIVRHLLEVDASNDYFIYCMREVPPELPAATDRVRYRLSRFPNRKIWQQVALPVRAARDGLDVLFLPSNSAPLASPVPVVATLHDLHPYVVPEAFDEVHASSVHGSRWRSMANRLYWKWMMRILASGDRVIVPSESTRRDLTRILGTPDERIAVVPEGIDPDRFRPAERGAGAGFRERHELPDRYVLCVGTHGYKNLAGSVRGFGLVRQPGVKLVVAGSTRPLREEVRTLVRDLELDDDVLFVGFFPDEEMADLYGHAELLLFPSFYEGFGLPILEAFACGTPVVTSDRGSMPEVAGDAALLVDPHDADAIAEAVRSILTNDAVGARLRRAGIRRAAGFSWTRAARYTLEVLERHA